MEKDKNILRRIIISDDKSRGWNGYGYILFQLQYKMIFWKKWITQSSFRVKAAYIYGVDYIDAWKDEYPDAKIINNSKRFLNEMKIENIPFKTSATVAP